MTETPAEPDRKKTSELTRGGISAFAVKMVAVGLAFASQFLIARLLGKAGYGDFSFALVTFNFLVVGAVAGGDAAATRFVALFRQSKSQLQDFFGWMNRRALILSSLYLLITLGCIQIVREFIDERNIWIVTQVLCLAIPLQVFSYLRQGVLRGFSRPVLSQIPEELVRPTLTIILVLLLGFAWPSDWATIGAIHVAAILVFVTLVVLIVGQVLMYRVARQKKSDISEGELASDTDCGPSQWRSMAWASTLTAIAMTILSQCDVWMLGVMMESEDVGPYAAAARYAAFTIFGINAVNTALGPLVSRSVGQKIELQQLASRAATISALIGGGIALVLLVFPHLLLNIFGQGFDEAALSLRILVVANLLNVLCGSVGMLLNMTGHHNDFMKVLLLSLVTNIVLNAILIPIYQTTGAALATGISTALWNFLAWRLVRIRIGIRPTLGGWF